MTNLESRLFKGFYTYENPEKVYTDIAEAGILIFDSEKGITGTLLNPETAEVTGKIIRGLKVNTGHDLILEFTKENEKGKQIIYSMKKSNGKIAEIQGYYKGFWRYDTENPQLIAKKTRARMVKMTLY